MSTRMISVDVTAQIAEFIYQINEFGFNNFGMSCPKELSNVLWRSSNRSGLRLSPSTIFGALYKINKVACSDKNTETVLMPNITPIIKPRKANRDGEEIQPWHYKMAKYLDIYLYQIEKKNIAKDETMNDWFKAICALRDLLFAFIVRNTLLYINNGNIDYFDSYFYQIVDRDGEKYVVIDGYYYDEGEDNGGGTARCVQYSNVEFPLADFVENAPSSDAIDDLASLNKQYIEDMKHDDALESMQHFYKGVTIHPILLAELHKDTPCGYYVDYPGRMIK